MWEDFSDFELAELAGSYGLEDILEFNDSLQLSNRTVVESALTVYEHDLAFPLDFYSEEEYTSLID